MRYPLETLASLDEMQVASPCTVSWDGMAGDERARFCSQCQKHVYDLSALTAQQALALIHEKEGDLCVRFYRRRDGTVKTADCTLAIGNLVRRPWRWAAALVGTILAVVVPTAGCARYHQGEPCMPTSTEKTSQGLQTQKQGKLVNPNGNAAQIKATPTIKTEKIQSDRKE